MAAIRCVYYYILFSKSTKQTILGNETGIVYFVLGTKYNRKLENLLVNYLTFSFGLTFLHQ